MELWQSTNYELANARLEQYVLSLGLDFLHEEAKHGLSPAEYRRDENCIRMARYMRGYDRFWVLLHELGHHLSGASDELLIDGDLGVTEAIADLIAIGVLQRLQLPLSGPVAHLESVRVAFPNVAGTDLRHASLIEQSVQALVDAVERE